MSAQSSLNSDAADIRVMLVEDSAVVRGMVRKWLDSVPDVQVVGSADNGQKAIDLVGAARPDIIVLDIEMPVMDGLTALPGILRKVPQAKVIISSTLSRKNAEVTLRAMSLGASDYITKPSFTRDGQDARSLFKEELVRKVVGLAQAARPTSSVRGEQNTQWSPIPAANARFKFRKASSIQPRVLVIGASTGGPAALTKVFEDLKPQLGTVPVLVTQHMPPTFTALLGEKLAQLSGLKGGEAVAGELVVAGRLYVAPGGKHMRIAKGSGGLVIDLDDGPPINHCKPAVDPLFESVAGHFGNSALAAILTGMGADGAAGSVEIADAGGTVYAQDEASSVVWGMPGATALAGACTAIVDLDKMGERLGRALHGGVSL